VTPRARFNLGAALILAGLATLCTLDALTGGALALAGTVGIALVLSGVALLNAAEPGLEAHQ